MFDGPCLEFSKKSNMDFKVVSSLRATLRYSRMRLSVHIGSSVCNAAKSKSGRFCSCRPSITSILLDRMCAFSFKERAECLI